MTLQYTYLPEGIHEFAFHEANRHAVDEYLVILQEIMPELQPDDPWLSILDMSDSGMIPLRYASSTVTSFSKPYLDVRLNRTLIIHNPGAIGQIAHALVNPLNKNVRFITQDKRDDGVDWLLHG